MHPSPTRRSNSSPLQPIDNRSTACCLYEFPLALSHDGAQVQERTLGTINYPLLDHTPHRRDPGPRPNADHRGLRRRREAEQPPVYSDPVRLARGRGVEPREPGRTETPTGALELRFVLDDRDARLDRSRVFLFGACERHAGNERRAPRAL